jgi:hypothetical protein
VRWHSSLVLICTSFMARDGEHFFMCFLSIWTSSFEQILFTSVAHSFIAFLIFEQFSLLRSLYTLVICPLSDQLLAKIFFHSASLLFLISSSTYFSFIPTLYNLSFLSP